MKKAQARVNELTYFLRILQLIHEMDSVDKVHRMLLSLSTCGALIGCDRAMLLEVDHVGKIIRGVLGFENSHTSGEKGGAKTFEKLAREVFDGFESADSSECTLRTRSFSIQLDYHHSALVKAVHTNYPVLADSELSEFSSDPFFDYFGSKRYIAVPIAIASGNHHDEGRGKANLVLAADKTGGDDKLDVEDISLLFSLAQQAALATRSILERADAKRRSRILAKLTRIMSDADPSKPCDEGVKFGMSMISQALEASGCILKDFGKQNTIYVKPAKEHSFKVHARDDVIASCLDAVLERTAGRVQVESGDSTHPLLSEEANIGGFIAAPLLSCGDVVGSIVIYYDKNKRRRYGRGFRPTDRMFLETAASILASGINSVTLQERIKRNEEFLEEIHSNLKRERQNASMGLRGREYAETMKRELEKLKDVLDSGKLSGEGAKKLSRHYGNMREQTTFYLQEFDREKDSFKMLDIHRLIGKLARKWKTKMESRGVEVTLRIPSSSSKLLMDEKSITRAFENILESVGACLTTGERALIECSREGDREVVVIADNGFGLPGNLLTRLFMPFCNLETDDERKNALSLAGELIHKHGGEINVRSSLGWKTVLIVSFDRAANRDRRKGPGDRRSGAKSRRAGDVKRK